MIEAAARRAGELLLPVDHVVAERIEAGAPTRVVKEIPDGWIGSRHRARNRGTLREGRGQGPNVFWNGPMGVFEIDAFAKGTEAVAGASPTRAPVRWSAAATPSPQSTSSASATRIGHLSTGGGASLEFVQGLTLPGVAALENPGMRRPVLAANWKMHKTVGEAEAHSWPPSYRSRDASRRSMS